jgi:DNA excision repair protein ERCC-3
MEITNLKKEIEELESDLTQKKIRAIQIEESLKEQENNLKYVSDKVSEKLGDILEKDAFLTFFKKPYAIIPFGKEKVLVAVPKFIKDFQVGWLWKETESFYIYQFDQYSAWLSDAPKDLLNEINFKKNLDLNVEGNIIHFSPEWKDAIKKKLNYHIKDIGENQATIIKGHIFDVIAETIENGCLPFSAKPVLKSDIRESKSEIKLRQYQESAEAKFLETGAIGVFHPTGAGKSFIALHLIDILKGKKLIVVPTRTLIEQWSYYIDTYIPHAKQEVKIVTYQGFRDSNDDYALVVYDECQRLPADTFARLAVISTKYRIGLSASPHREDGRESYIFALTGFPIGLNWKDYMKTAKKEYHPIYVHVVKSIIGKMNKVNELLDRSKKTFIFCDTIEFGKRIAHELDVPYIYGETNNRLQEIEENRVSVVSRVMDVGVSVKDLQRIIEVDFLFGSRQQELQRTGRLMHSEKTNLRHDIIMTEGEFSQYGKRLWALQEKGFTIKINN